MNGTLMIFGLVTAIGTAILTVASVWRLLMAPMAGAIKRIEESVTRLEIRVESGEARRESDVKEIWKHLALRNHE